MKLEPDPTAETVTEEAFFQFLRRHRGGEAITELGETLTRVVAAVNLTGKGGQFTLKIKVAPASRGVGAVVIADDIDDKIPEMPGGNESFWFATEKGELCVDDPRQRALKLEVVPPAAEKRVQN